MRRTRVGAAESARLRIDWPSCVARGLCAELLPERIGVDEWGYPLLAREPVEGRLLELAREAAQACPARALHVVPE